MTNWNNVLAVLIKSLLWLYFSSYNYKYSNFLKKSNIDQFFFLKANPPPQISYVHLGRRRKCSKTVNLMSFIANIRIIFDINKFLTKKYYMKYII